MAEKWRKFPPKLVKNGGNGGKYFRHKKRGEHHCSPLTVIIYSYDFFRFKHYSTAA